MSANISNFLNSFSNEFARPCNFDVQIIPQQQDLSIGVKELYIPRDFIFKCESSELPSRTFSLVEQKTYGPVQYFPVQNFYEKINMVFLCSDDMKEKTLFDNWMDIISQSKYGQQNQVRYDFNYKTQYKSDINIRQYNMYGDQSYYATLHEAFPISVHALKLDWAALNDVHKLMVTFVYKDASFSPTNT